MQKKAGHRTPLGKSCIKKTAPIRKLKTDVYKRGLSGFSTNFQYSSFWDEQVYGRKPTSSDRDKTLKQDGKPSNLGKRVQI